MKAIIYKYTNVQTSYCKFGNVRDNFIFAYSINRHICDIRNWRFGHEIRISVKDRVIFSFLEGFIFIKLHIGEVSQK